MKRLIIIAFMVMPLMFAGVKTVSASGIPTVDIAALLQGLVDGFTRIQEFKEQIDGAKKRLNQLKESANDYKDMVEGHYDFETLLNDPEINKALALEDWRGIYESASDISDLREEFDMKSDDPKKQAVFDRQLQAYNAQTKFYDMSVERNNNLKSLLDQFSAATNPAAKADLANSIDFENARIKNDAKMMETMTALMEQTSTLEANKMAMEQKELMRTNGIAVDYSSAYDGL